MFETELGLAELLKLLPPGVAACSLDELEREAAVFDSLDHHVYFFDAPLGPEAQRRFLADIAGFFDRQGPPLANPSERRLVSWAFPFEAKCAQFRAFIPVGDPSLFLPYNEVCRTFSREVQRIISFQGAKFIE